MFGTVAGAPDEGEDGPPNPCDESATTAASETQTDPVNLIRGEFFITGANHLTPDPVISGRGLSLDFTRTYRSQFAQNGVVGYGWDLRIHKRLRQRTDDSIVISTGTCREMEYTFDVPTSAWVAPPGVAASLVPNGTGFTQTFANGSR